MKMAKASEDEQERAIKLTEILLNVEKGYYPVDYDEDGEELPTFFDEDDIDHLKRFYELVMKYSAGVHRVTWGFHTLMHNDLVDPALDYLDIHPRFLEVAEAEEGTPA